MKTVKMFKFDIGIAVKLKQEIAQEPSSYHITLFLRNNESSSLAWKSTHSGIITETALRTMFDVKGQMEKKIWSDGTMAEPGGIHDIPANIKGLECRRKKTSNSIVLLGSHVVSMSDATEEKGTLLSEAVELPKWLLDKLEAT